MRKKCSSPCIIYKDKDNYVKNNKLIYDKRKSNYRSSTKI